MNIERLNFLPGSFTLETGESRDYFMLAKHHYRDRAPRTWAGVWVVRYVPLNKQPSRVVAVAVLSWPTAVSLGRENALGWRGLSYGGKIRLANANVRTISRVIVHPQFRSLGLASLLVRWVCNHCPTRYCESSAKMGRAHPLFTQAGMTRYEPVDVDRPVYFLWDRERHSGVTHPGVI